MDWIRSLIFCTVLFIVRFSGSLANEKHQGNCSIVHSVKYGGLFADCSGRNLTRIPRFNNNSKLKENIKALDVSNNKITIKQDDFIGYTNLVYLNLNKNGLKYLPPNAFAGCEKLQILYLKHNTLKYNKISFPVDVFSNLTHLRYLNIGKNVHGKADLKFIGFVLKNVKALENLTVDSGENLTFSEDYKHLMNLRHLCFSGREANCQVSQIFNDTFTVFSSSIIHTLDLSFCKRLHNIEVNAYAPLVSLKILKLNNDNRLGLHKAFLSLYGLRERNLTSVDFESVAYKRYEQLANVTVTDEILWKDTLWYAASICLSELNLGNNRILYIDYINLLNQTIAKCLLKIYFSGNAVYGLYNVGFLVPQLAHLNVELIYISDEVSPYQHVHRKQSSSLQDNPTYFIPLPPKLKTFVLDNTDYLLKLSKGSIVNITSNNIVENVSVSYAGKIELEGTVYGMNKLKTLKLAYVRQLILDEAFFDNFHALRNLNLNSVGLPRNYFLHHSARLFEKLVRLEMLHLSGNYIHDFQEEVFRSNKHLRRISLSNNLFGDIPFKLDYTPHLEILDLSHNSITSLSQQTMQSLDNHASNISNFTLLLLGNPFSCTCETMDFVLWIKTATYLDTRFRNSSYHCYTGSNIRVSFDSIDEEELWQKCTGRNALFISTLLFSFCMASFLCFVLDLKHKTQIVVFFIKLFTKGARVPKREDFQYDVFVGYAYQDYEFACTKLRIILEDRFNYRIYLHDRDGIPGEDRANSILTAIRNSWKMVLVISENFLEDEWFVYTTHAAALYSIAELIPKRLILLRDKHNPFQVPDNLLCVVHEDSILPIPDESDEASWEVLNRLLK